MKRVFKEFCKKAVAAAAGAALLIQAQVPTFVKAAEAPQYISEVYLSYGKTPEEAKKWLTDNGYTVLDQDLNEGAQGGITADWLGWTQLHSEKRSVYLGYKTTTEKDEAITDMRAMNMKGGFSYEEYEKLLENKKNEINSFISDMKSALAEYRANYKKGAAKAKAAHDYLNTITDDDCGGKNLGDLLLEPIKQEMSEEDYKAAPEDHVDMVTLVMQGNTEAVTDIMSYLLLAADTSEDSWLTRLEKQGGSDALYEKYEKEYPALSESKLNALIVSEYDEKAKMLAERIEDLREALKPYTDSKLKAGADDAAVKAYFEEHTDESDVQWSLAATKYIPLTEIKYEDGTLADLVTSTEYDFTGVEDRMELYPIIDSMSEGQRSLIEYIDLGEMVISGNISEEGWQENYKKTQEELKDKAASSAYAGVDRSVFDPAGVALTSEAREIQNTSGASYTNKLFDIETSTLQYIGYGSSAALLAAGASAWIYGASKVAKSETTVLTAYGKASEKALEMENIYFGKARESGKMIKDYLDKLKISDINGAGFANFSAGSGSEISYLDLNSHIQNMAKEGKTIVCQANNKSIKASQLLEDLEKAKPEFKTIQNEYKIAQQNYYNANIEKSKFDDKTKERIIEHFEPRSKGLKYVGVSLCIAAIALAVGSAAVTLYDVYKYYHQDYAPIPRKIVHESTDEKGRFVYTVYDCTLCNRKAQGFMSEKLKDLEDYGDMNGDVGKEWLALYTTKDKAAGEPIRADLIAQKGSNEIPLDKSTGIRMFGKTDTVNIVSEEYGYNDELNGLYIFASTGSAADDKTPAETPEKAETTESTPEAAESTSSAESTPTETTASEGTVSEAKSANSEAPQTASVIGGGTLVMSCAGSAAVGALICFLLMRKKRAA